MCSLCNTRRMVETTAHLRIIAFITHGADIRQILDHMGPTRTYHTSLRHAGRCCGVTVVMRCGEWLRAWPTTGRLASMGIANLVALRLRFQGEKGCFGNQNPCHTCAHAVAFSIRLLTLRLPDDHQKVFNSFDHGFQDSEKEPSQAG